MDGATLIRQLREALGEQSGSAYIDTRTSYEYLWEAAIEVVRVTKCLTATQDVTTVADQAAYVLNADFLELNLRDADGEDIIKYSDGSSTSWPVSGKRDEIIRGNNTTSTSIPSRFYIQDKASLYSQITGTATGNGTASAGVSSLTDSAGLFASTDYVSAGDVVHDTAQSSSGYVLSVTSGTVLSTAMFTNSSGASAGWTSGDAYVIQPQGRMQLVFDPPPSTAGHTATIYYIQRPAPVFHDYGMYRIPAHYLDALVSWAAFKYKIRGQEPGFGDVFKREWKEQLAVTASSVSRVIGRRGFSMSMRGVK